MCSFIYIVNWDSSLEKNAIKDECLSAQVGYSDELQAGQDPGEVSRFLLTVCAEVLWLFKPTVASAVRLSCR